VAIGHELVGDGVGEIVLDYLKEHNIDHIDYLVTSHADADHIGGNAAIIRYYETEANGIGAIYDPGIASSSQTYQDYLDAVEKYNVTLYETHAGDDIPFEGVQTQVLNPPENYIDSEQRNENSIVVRLTFGQTSFILPGDIEESGESHLVDEYDARLNSTILKAAHHGSGGSSTNSFLDAVSPKLALISSAYESRYDHPRPETLRRLADHDIEAYWTATHGNIVLTSDGATIDIATQRQAPTDPTSVRDGDPVEPGTDGPVTHRESIKVAGGSSPPSSGTETDTPVPTTTAPTSSTTGTSVATDGGTETTVPVTGDSSLAVKTVHADAEGDDTDNLADEYIVFTNTGSHSLDVSGWTVSDASSHTYTIPSDTTIGAGETLTLHTGEGTDVGNDLYWGSGSAIWNNGGDTITVTNEQDEQVLTEEY
jgi:competence protein ComEC